MEPGTGTDRAPYHGEEEDGMTANPWTPGPWQLFASPWNPDQTVPAFIGTDPSNAVCLAAVKEADSRLIVAAPEMAELLAEYVALYGTQPGTLYDKAVRTLVRIRGEA
jgi:hypothetical protein